MKCISINGKKLHELLMPGEPYKTSNAQVSLQYPKSRIIFNQTDDGFLKLTIPCKLALEMYRIGILPQDVSLFFPVEVSGKPIGKYKVVNILYPNSSNFSNNVFITLKKL